MKEYTMFVKTVESGTRTGGWESHYISERPAQVIMAAVNDLDNARASGLVPHDYDGALAFQLCEVKPTGARGKQIASGRL